MDAAHHQSASGRLNHVLCDKSALLSLLLLSRDLQDPAQMLGNPLCLLCMKCFSLLSLGLSAICLKLPSLGTKDTFVQSVRKHLDLYQYIHNHT